MRKIFKRKNKISTREAAAVIVSTSISDALTNLIQDLQRHPIKVEHDIKRHIPKPASAMFIARGFSGQEYRHHVDMSWKDGFPMTFPLSHFTGRPEDQGMPVELHVVLDYDPRER